MKKSKAQITRDYDLQNILSFASHLIFIVGFFIVIFLEYFFSNHVGFLNFLGCFMFAFMLNLRTGKCPICDRGKKRTQLWRLSYSYDDGCENCQMSEQEIIDYVESLIKSKK